MNMDRFVFFFFSPPCFPFSLSLPLSLSPFLFNRSWMISRIVFFSLFSFSFSFSFYLLSPFFLSHPPSPLRPEPNILCFEHPNFVKEQSNSTEETKSLSDKIENLQDSLAAEKEAFLSLQAKIKFLEMMQNYEGEEETENVGPSSEVDHQKRLLKELKGENRATQEEISSLITQLSESHATHERKKTDFNKQMQAMPPSSTPNNTMEVDENSSSSANISSSHLPTTPSKKTIPPSPSPNAPGAGVLIPPSRNDQLRQVSQQNSEDLSALRVILEKISGVKVCPILGEGAALSVETISPAFPTLKITMHLTEKTRLKGVAVEPSSPVNFTDLVQYCVALGGEVQVFLGEYLTRLALWKQNQN